MRVVMLGWEFPPFIAGGLGTACYGLTKALDRLGHEILFVLPRAVDRSLASHVRMFSPEGLPVATKAAEPGLGPDWTSQPLDPRLEHAVHALPGAPGSAFAHTTFVGVPSGFAQPYGKPAVTVRPQRKKVRVAIPGQADMLIDSEEDQWLDDLPTAAPLVDAPRSAGPGYQGDLFAEAERYSRMVVALLRGQRFDVIHAHDWLTFPAGQALARVTGKPLLVHVHSTEFDRSGEHINQRVYDVERRGMMAALRVVCVSELTKSICTRRFGVDPARVDVVYNGIDSEGAQPRPGDNVKSKDKIVLFLGRITMQKGPEYFIGAAKRVLEKVPDTKFFMAGSGDMELRMIELAAQLGIGHRVLFTGFLRGRDVDRIFQMADCYVMPSVSEPFGIAPLEAIRNDVPTIISKQSGVSEVLTHALKVDFWDVDDIANKIVAVLRHPPLSQTLRQHGGFELRRLTWEGAAQKCVQAYEAALAGQLQPTGRF